MPEDVNENMDGFQARTRGEKRRLTEIFTPPKFKSDDYFEMDEDSDAPKGSPFATIRSPKHWIRYPYVIEGVIREVAKKVKNPALRVQVINCLMDVMNNQSTFKSAHEKHFEYGKKNLDTPRRYLHLARELMMNCLGQERIDQRLAPHISVNSTFDDIKMIVKSFDVPFIQFSQALKSTDDDDGPKHSVDSARTSLSGKKSLQFVPKKILAAKALLNASSSRSTIANKAKGMARFGLEDSEDEDEPIEPELNINTVSPQPILAQFSKACVTHPQQQQPIAQYYQTAEFSGSNSSSMPAKKRNRLDTDEDKSNYLSQEENPSPGPNLTLEVRSLVDQRLAQQQSSSTNGRQINGTAAGPSFQVEIGGLGMQVARAPDLPRMVIPMRPGAIALSTRRRHFRGTSQQLKEEIRKILEGNMTNPSIGLDDLAAMVVHSVVKEYRMARLLHQRHIPQNLLLATTAFCCRYIELDNLELSDIGDENVF